jgi:hypothetical protein
MRGVGGEEMKVNSLGSRKQPHVQPVNVQLGSRALGWLIVNDKAWHCSGKCLVPLSTILHTIPNCRPGYVRLFVWRFN